MDHPSVRSAHEAASSAGDARKTARPEGWGARRQAMRERYKAHTLAAFYAKTPADRVSRQVLRRAARLAIDRAASAARALAIKNRRRKAERAPLRAAQTVDAVPGMNKESGA